MISGLILAYILVGEVIACVVAIDGSIYDHRNGLYVFRSPLVRCYVLGNACYILAISRDK